MEHQKPEKGSKQYESFKRNIHNHIKDYERVRQWADIMNWLLKLQQYLSPTNTKNIGVLPHSITLAKRLAQCLNPKIPAGVHTEALKAYALILSKFENRQSLLPLMSIGLFPFFQYSSSQLKYELLKMYEQYFLCDSGSVQMVISLLNALLTGLNQNNQQLAKKIFILCEKISKKYGYIWIDGAVWVNILKSSKVKIAGFKYFMKVFKDRDRQKQNKEEKQKQQREQQMIKGQQNENQQLPRERKPSMKIKKSSSSGIKVMRNCLKQEEITFLQGLYNERQIPDGIRNRFPNFSVLVINALTTCLQSQVESLTKRAALDLIVSYLKLSETEIISKQDGHVLVESMLKILIKKQFSLSRRIYTYLFDQPNMEGVYKIDRKQRQYEIGILLDVLRSMLNQNFQQKNRKINQQHKTSLKNAEDTLIILQTLLVDHQQLIKVVLPQLSYEILTFIKNNCFHNNRMVSEVKKKVLDFNQIIILPNRMIFIEAILKKVENKQIEKQVNPKIQDQLIELIAIIDFYIYTLHRTKKSSRKDSLKNSKHSSQSLTQESDSNQQLSQELKQICLSVISKILKYLKATSLTYQKLSNLALDLANKINTQTLKRYKDLNLPEQMIEIIDYLIDLLPHQNIYARLLTLHPSPKKEILLPHINQGSFAIVCINNLLPKDRTLELTQDEKKNLFYAIFKLLQCHLWESQTLDFIEEFIKKYPEVFQHNINLVDPSQWLIYWRISDGNVKGGVVRMIKDAKNSNPLKKHMSCKWIQDSQHVVSKIIAPIYDKISVDLTSLEKGDNQKIQQEIIEIYHLMKIVFQKSKQSFARFFFVQYQKYIMPLLQLLFVNLECGSQILKTQSMDILKFVLSYAETYQQKQQFISLTLKRILVIFRKMIILKVHSSKSQNIQSSYDIIQSKQLSMNRVSSFQKQDSVIYLQQIQIIEYLIAINSSIKKSIKRKDFKSLSIFAIIEESQVYSQVIMGLFQSELPYIRTLYLDYLKDSCQLLSKSEESNKVLGVLINLILDKLFLILKSQDISSIQNKIKQKNQHNLKSSMVRLRRIQSDQEEEQKQNKTNLKPSKQYSASFYQDKNVSKNDFNIESKYSQMIEIWNSVKFYIRFSIQHKISNLPIVNLLSLILQSFPFSYLKYTQMIISDQSLNKQAMQNYQLLQEEIKSITGLKKQVIEIIDIIWAKFNLEICDFLIERGDPRILIHCTMDPVKVLTTLSKSQKLNQVSKYYKNSKLNLPKNVSHYNGQILTKQNQINYFIYLYLMYCNFTLIKNTKVGGFLEQLLSIMRILRVSNHIQSKMWISEIIQLLSERILLNKQIYIDGGQKIRQELQSITKQTIDQLLGCIVKSKQFTHRTQIKTGFINNLFGKQQKESSLYDFVKMYPPTIYMSYENYASKHKKNNKRQNIEQVQIVREQCIVDNFLFSQWLNRTQEQFQSYLSICSIKTLIAIGNNLVINIFEKDIAKVTHVIKDIILVLLPVCQDKSPNNQVSIELISEYIYIVLENKSLKEELLPSIRRNLLTVYMGNDFFKCTSKTLFYWKSIIDYCTEGIDLLNQLLAKEGLFDGLLKGRTEVLRQKIKSFERICFVIYSGRIDKYENKLRTVLESLNEVMKQQNPPAALLILMLFCVRILLMRLSQNSLNKIFKSIWPGLITILIQIFNPKHKKSKDINLILAALKVVELIHALQVEQFNFHKWMFVLDFFGIRIQPGAGQLSFQQEKSQIITPFIFKPYMTNLLPIHTFKCTFKPTYEPVELRNHNRVQKRKLIIKQPSIQTMEEVQNLAYVLMQYIAECNQKNVKVSKKEIEELIEGDFISLDDYIFLVK